MSKCLPSKYSNTWHYGEVTFCRTMQTLAFLQVPAIVSSISKALYFVYILNSPTVVFLYLDKVCKRRCALVYITIWLPVDINVLDTHIIRPLMTAIQIWHHNWLCCMFLSAGHLYWFVFSYKTLWIGSSSSDDQERIVMFSVDVDAIILLPLIKITAHWCIF